MWYKIHINMGIAIIQNNIMLFLGAVELLLLYF